MDNVSSFLSTNNSGQQQQEQQQGQLERIGAHSHVRGLGLDPDSLEPRPVAEGLVGQLRARKALGLFGRMVVAGGGGGVSGRALLLAGPPGSGKTALALGLARDLQRNSGGGGGQQVPFVHVSASELFSLELSKAEALLQALRKAIAVNISEDTEVLEGEVVDLQVTRGGGGAGGGQQQQAKLTLKTTDMETVYELGAKMLDGLTKAQVRAGDVVAIDRASGKVQRLGRSFSRSSDYDATGSASKFVRCPDGELQKRRQVVHSVTLHDMDVINSRAQGFLALFAGDTGEVRPEVRAQIDAKVAEWRQEGKAALAPGLLFVDECHVLDPEAFAFLGRALESELAPLLVLATNRAQLARAVPRDLLDRLVVVVADWPLPEEQVRQVLELRAAEEEAALGPEALVALHRVALETRSLRYACNLLSLAHLVAAKRKSPLVEAAHVRHVYRLFLDTGRSAAAASTATSATTTAESGQQPEEPMVA